MGQPTFNQVSHWGRNDDGSESTATFKGAQGSDWTQTVDTKFRVRFLIDEQNVKAWSDVSFNLYYQVAGGGFSAVTNTSAVQYTSSLNYTSATDCVSRLTGGSGSFVTDNNGQVHSTATATNSGAINGYFEVEYCLTIDSAQVSNGQVVNLRVYDGTTAINSYVDEPAITIDKPTGVVNQSSFRIRSGDTEILSSTSGWSGSSGTDATIGRGHTFRIAFEIEETAGVNVNQAYRLYYSKDSGAYTAMTQIPYENATSYPTIWGVISDQYAKGDAITTNQVNVSLETFTNGHGVEYATAQGNYDSNSVTLNNQCTVLEFAIRIPSWYDSGGYNSTGTTYDFRLYTTGGSALDAYTDTPRVTVGNTVGHIGGTPAETQAKWGVWKDTNGNLYYATENTEVTNDIMMVKSTDGGDTWAGVDMASRPNLTDIESADAVQVGDTIYIAFDAGGQVDFMKFFTSDHPTLADQWGDSGNSNAPESVVTGKTENDQGCALVYRSDGTFVCFYRSGTTNEVIKYKIRSTGGTWGSENDLDTVNTIQTGIMAIKGSDSDVIHVFYTTEETVPNTIRHRSLLTNDTLTASEVVYSDVYDGGSGWQWGMNAPVVWDNGTNDYVLLPVYDDSDNFLYTVRITDDGSPETPVLVDNVTVMNDPAWMTSRFPIVRLAVDPSDDTIYLLFADATTQDIWLYTSTNGGGSWSEPTELNDGLTTEMIIGSIFTHSSGNGGATVFGYVYADRYGGFTDWVFYDEYVIDAGATIYYQTNTGSWNSVGAILRKINKTQLGSATDSGDISKKTSKPLDGDETATGIVTYFKKAFHLLSGSETATGDIIKKAIKLLSGNETATGDIIKKAIKLLSGNETATGIVNAVKQAGLFLQSLSGSMGSSGSLSKKMFEPLFGDETSTGDILKKMFESLSGVETPSGDIIKKAIKLFSGDETANGDVSTLKKMFLSLFGNETANGDILRKIFKILSGDETSSGEIFRKIFKTLLGSETATGIVNAVKQAGIYYQSLSGSMNSSGEVLKLTKRILSGIETPSGDIIKKVIKLLLGDETANGDVSTLKKMFLSLVGNETTTGDVSTLKKMFLSLVGSETATGDILRKIFKILSGDETSSGEIFRKIFKTLLGSETATGIVNAVKQAGIYYQSLSGSMNSSGEVLKLTKRILSGIETPSGDVLKVVKKLLDGVMNSSGTISAIRKAFISLSGSMNSDGDILRVVYKILFGSETGTGNLIKKTIKAFSGSLSSSGILNTLKLGNTYFQSLSGSMNSSGEILKNIKKSLFGSSSFDGNVYRIIFKYLFGNETPTGEISKKIFELLSGNETATGNTIKKSIKLLSGSETSTGEILKLVKKILSSLNSFDGLLNAVKLGSGIFYQSLSGSMNSSGTLVKKTFKLFDGLMNSSGDILKKIFKVLSGDETATGDIFKKVKKIFSGNSGFSGDILKKVFKYLYGDQLFGGDLFKKILKSLSGLMNSSGSVLPSRLITILLSGSFSSDGDLTKKISKILVGASSFVGDISKKIRKSFYGIMNSIGILLPLFAGEIKYGEGTISLEKLNSATISFSKCGASKTTMTFEKDTWE